MPLSSLVEVIPLESPVTAEVAVPGSKSITNRALILAALASGRTRLEGALFSEDTQVMVDCLQKLGFQISIEPDFHEPGNRTITVDGRGGEVPGGGALEAPLELFVGNSGTTARFVAALACLGNGAVRLSGAARMHERPQRDLFIALRGLGYRIESAGDRLPAVIYGGGPRPGAKCRARIDESSQFASALLLVRERGKWDVAVEGEDSAESPYVRMTTDLVKAFPQAGGAFQIEPDASSASYFWGAGWLLETSQIRVAKWMERSLQIDAQFPHFVRPFAPSISRLKDLGDSIMTAIVLAPFAEAPKIFTDLGRLRLQECERVRALRTELAKCGANVIEQGDTLRVTPGPLHGAEIETYGDHRMAMCFAMIGLRAPGIRIKDPACVKKTFPNFFDKLAAPPPAGLGATLLFSRDR